MFFKPYATSTIKLLIDFKYIPASSIIFLLGVIGFIMSIIAFLVSSKIPCVEGRDFMCYFIYNNEKYIDSYNTFDQINIEQNFYLEIFISIPIYLISSFITLFSEILIIQQLDMIYLIPVDSFYFFIYELIDFFSTINYTNSYRNIRFIFEIIADLNNILFCSVFLEIIVLKCFNLNKDIRASILVREKQDRELSQIFEPSFIEVDDEYRPDFNDDDN